MESNSIENKEGEGEFYFPCFDIVPFAESKVFEAASDPTTRDVNRSILYSLYERMAGKTQPKEDGISWTEQMK